MPNGKYNDKAKARYAARKAQRAARYEQTLMLQRLLIGEVPHSLSSLPISRTNSSGVRPSTQQQEAGRAKKIYHARPIARSLEESDAS